MPFRFLLLALLLSLSACSKPDLPHSVVRAGSEEELAATRAELAGRFGTPALADYDVALQELQLAGMDRGLASAADRAAAMREAVNGRTLRAVEILGWQARRARLLAEIASLTPTLDHDLQTQAAKGAATPAIVVNRIQNVQDILAKSRRLAAEADAKLAAWGAAPP
jgi:predicted transcriptional regulator